MNTSLGYMTIHGHKIELRPRQGAFALFYQNRWLPIRRSNPDKPAADLTTMSSNEAWDMLGMLDYVNHDAILHHFGVPWTRGHGADRTALLRSLYSRTVPALDGV